MHGQHALESTLRILGLCACVSSTTLRQNLLLDGLECFGDWNGLVEQAEVHGLAPLLYFHCREAGVVVPRQAQRILRSLVVRHEQANGIRMEVLKEILEAFQTAGIEVVPLKGAVLAHLLYPRPGLRPMRDLDLLVPIHQAREAQAILREIGFNAPQELTPDMPHSMHHLAGASRRDPQKDGGYLMSVEIHHHLFSEAGRRARGALHDFSRFRTYTMDGATVTSLGIEDLLGHLYGHTFTNPRFSSDLRLVNVADMIGLLEKFESEIAWDYLKQRYPGLYRVLPLFNLFTPLSQFPLSQSETFDYPRWPKARVPRARTLGNKLKDSLYDILRVPRWWLCFRYGLRRDWRYFGYRWFLYPAQMALLFLRTGVELRDRRNRQRAAVANRASGT